MKILAVCHAWNFFFAVFYYPAVFVACRPKCKIDHLIHCHCGGSICETKKNCMSDFFFILCIPSSYKRGISQSVCHRWWSLYHIWCIFGISLVWFLTETKPIGCSHQGYRYFFSPSIGNDNYRISSYSFRPWIVSSLE